MVGTESGDGTAGTAAIRMYLEIPDARITRVGEAGSPCVVMNLLAGGSYDGPVTGRGERTSETVPSVAREPGAGEAGL